MKKEKIKEEERETQNEEVLEKEKEQMPKTIDKKWRKAREGKNRKK